MPVACSRAASLPEVAGDAALYFDPLSTEGMAASIARLAGDAALRADLRERALTRARTFTWERTARQTLAVYREVLGAVPAARGGAPAPVS